jgi:hypothetical protein
MAYRLLLTASHFRADSRSKTMPELSVAAAAAQSNEGKVLFADVRLAQGQEQLARFYGEYPSLAGAFPHRNPRNGALLSAMSVTCDCCKAVLPLEEVHGLINDHVNCTEIRYVTGCPQCRVVVHNVLRVNGPEMRFMREGEWNVATLRPWWHCLWPWPLDRDAGE